MEKNIKAIKSEMRADTYAGITDYLTSVGDTAEPGVDGIFVYDPDREMWMEISVVVKDENKFDIVKAREAYAEKMARIAERARIKAEKAQEKAEKAAAKAKENA